MFSQKYRVAIPRLFSRFCIVKSYQKLVHARPIPNLTSYKKRVYKEFTARQQLQAGRRILTRLYSYRLFITGKETQSTSLWNHFPFCPLPTLLFLLLLHLHLHPFLSLLSSLHIFLFRISLIPFVHSSFSSSLFFFIYPMHK